MLYERLHFIVTAGVLALIACELAYHAHSTRTQLRVVVRELRGVTRMLVEGHMALQAILREADCDE
jgi:hypothetical protein